MNNATTHLADFTEGVNKDHIPKYYGEALCNLASSDESVVALCADVAPPTESDLFKNIMYKYEVWTTDSKAVFFPMS